MNIALFLVLFTVLEVVTPLVTEGIKITFDGMNKKYNATTIALIVAITLSGLTGIFTYVAKGIDFSVINVFYIGFLMISNWLGATLGYDKIKEVIINLKDSSSESK